MPEVVDVVQDGEEASNKEIETQGLVSQGFSNDSRKNCWRMEGTEKTVGIEE